MAIMLAAWYGNDLLPIKIFLRAFGDVGIYLGGLCAEC